MVLKYRTVRLIFFPAKLILPFVGGTVKRPLLPAHTGIYTEFPFFIFCVLVYIKTPIDTWSKAGHTEFLAPLAVCAGIPAVCGDPVDQFISSGIIEKPCSISGRFPTGHARCPVIIAGGIRIVAAGGIHMEEPFFRIQCVTNGSDVSVLRGSENRILSEGIDGDDR